MKRKRTAFIVVFLFCFILVGYHLIHYKIQLVESELSENYISASKVKKYALNNDKFTILLSTFNRDRDLILHLDHWLQCSNVEQILVIWHNPDRDVPEFVQNTVNEYNCESENVDHESWKSVFCEDCTKATCPKQRVLIKKQTTNDITNRFKIDDFDLKTAAVFSIDDDLVLDCRLVSKGFEKWKELGEDSFVGFEPRLYNWYETKGPGYVFHEACNKERKCRYNSLFATKGSFLHHKYLNFFFDEEFRVVRAKAREYVTGEDLLMCFVHFKKSSELSETGSEGVVRVLHVGRPFKKKFHYFDERLEQLKNLGLLNVSIGRKKKYELDSVALTSRSKQHRPEITRLIGDLAMNTFGINKSAPLSLPLKLPREQHLWTFVEANGTSATKLYDCSNIGVRCSNKGLIAQQLGYT